MPHPRGPPLASALLPPPPCPCLQRLSFKTRLKLARLYLARADWAALRDQLAALEAAVASERGAAGAGDDVTMSGGSSSAASASGGGLLEVYALQIGMFTALKDIKRLSDVYAKAKAVAAVAVPHPGITGAINECGGKLAMKERDWEASRILFLDAFKAYEVSAAASGSGDGGGCGHHDAGRRFGEPCGSASGRHGLMRRR